MRKHAGGFVEHDFYWDIGDEERGRDGMNAREAAKRYNDHRHPAINVEDENEASIWINEVQQPSFYTSPADGVRNTQGGIIEDDIAIGLRKVGDLMFYKGLVWMYAGTDLGPIPLGVGHGSDINTTTGQFTRGMDYRSIQLATSTLVEHTDQAIQGFNSPLGERVCAYTLIPKNFASSRTRPYIFIRVTMALNANDPGAGVGGILQAFPYKARALVLVQEVNEVPGVQGAFMQGFLQFAPMYDPLNQQIPLSEELATINFVQTDPGMISVLDSNPLALDLDLARYFIQINVDTHVYTQDEVTTYNNANGTNYALADVIAATECTANIFSITLESESYLGLPPFINDGGLRYTIPERPDDI